MHQLTRGRVEQIARAKIFVFGKDHVIILISKSNYFSIGRFRLSGQLVGVHGFYSIYCQKFNQPNRQMDIVQRFHDRSAKMSPRGRPLASNAAYCKTA